MNNVYQIKTKHGVNLSIFYLSKVEDTFSPSKLEYFLDCIIYNLKPYIDDTFLLNLKLEIWHTRREDMPKDEIGHKNYLGLTWAKQKCIQLEVLDFSDELSRDIYVSNLLSHELGHLYQEQISLDISLLKPYWYNLRGKDEVQSTNHIELFAEDFRILFGSPMAKGIKRGDYIQATDKPFLYDFYLLIPKFNEYYREKNHENWLYSINKIEIKTDPFGILFYEDYGFFQWHLNKWCYLRKDGLYYYIQNNWVKTRKYINL